MCRFRLRADVQVENISESTTVWASAYATPPDLGSRRWGFCAMDGRLAHVSGMRVLARTEEGAPDWSGSERVAERDFDVIRRTCAVAQGPSEIVAGPGVVWYRLLSTLL